MPLLPSVLCSVPNLPGTLQEVLRVLKPVDAYRTRRRAQKELCCDAYKVELNRFGKDRRRLTLSVKLVVLENAGFESVNCQHFQAPVPIVSPHIVVWQPRKQIRHVLTGLK